MEAVVHAVSQICSFFKLTAIHLFPVFITFGTPVFYFIFFEKKKSQLSICSKISKC